MVLVFFLLLTLTEAREKGAKADRQKKEEKAKVENKHERISPQ